MTSPVQLADIRDQYLSQVVKGKTFAEVGGLWGTVNEKVSVAHRFGAASLSMIDIAPTNLVPDLWQAFRDRMSGMNISNVTCLNRDICQLQLSEIGQPFDVVHCAGVLYHHPHPMQMLVALRQITREHLVLTSAITQDVIENEQGRFQMPASGVLFVPALAGKEAAILKAYWDQFMIKAKGMVAIGITQPCTFDLHDFAPWWWLPTAAALRSMSEVAGFTVVDSQLTWNNNALVLLLKAKP